MSVFLNNIDYSIRISDSTTAVKMYKDLKVDLNFGSKEVHTSNFRHTENNSPNDALIGRVVPFLYNIGYIGYKGTQYKVLRGDYNFSEGDHKKYGFPAGIPVYLNNEFIILTLDPCGLKLGTLITICIHELGHIATNAELIKNFTKFKLTKENMFISGVSEGKADSFMYAKLKGDKKILPYTDNTYHYLFYSKDTVLDEYRKGIPQYESYRDGYRSIINEDIYSSKSINAF